MARDVLILSGLWDSGPQHWQTHWEHQHPDWTRARHRDFNHPDRSEWVAELDAAIANCDGPPLLIAHSLACAMVAHWASSGSSLKAAGALLVAPADSDAPSFPQEATGFAPMPLAPLPFPTTVVASSNDEYVSIARARQFADAWGSRFVNIGPVGHINSASDLGSWPEGERLLAALRATLDQR